MTASRAQATLPETADGMNSRRLLPADRIAQIEIGKYNYLAQEWHGPRPGDDEAREIISAVEDELEPVPEEQRIVVAVQMLNLYTTARQWSEDERSIWIDDTTDALMDCPRSLLPLLAKSRTLPFRGKFPPTGTEVSDWSRGEAGKLRAKATRASMALRYAPDICCTHAATPESRVRVNDLVRETTSRLRTDEAKKSRKKSLE